jgi:hypothetical protein
MSVNASPAVKFTPTATKTPTPTNFLWEDDFDFLNPYLPDTDKNIYQRYGSQDICGMLEKMAKEMPFESDNIKWTEEGRLTQLLTGVTRSSNVFTSVAHTLRVGETIKVTTSDGATTTKGRISSVTDDTFTALCGTTGGWSGTTGLRVYAFGSEFLKGTSGMEQSLNSQVEFFEQTPTIIKEMVKETGSNLAQKTWLYIDGIAGGKSGYVWYYKNYNDTVKRFKNKRESEMIEGELWASDLATAGYQGTQGLMSAAGEGNVSTFISDLTDIDEIIERANQQGAIAQNYMYITSAQSIAIDDMLAETNTVGLSYGMFDNNKEMGLSLQFSNFMRGNYEFAKSNWRYLDEPTQAGSNLGASKVHGLIVPSGSKPVYDIQKSTTAVQPFLHLRYRANGQTDRRFKIVVTGAEVGNSRVDEIVTDFITESALVLVGRNNVFKIQG